MQPTDLIPSGLIFAVGFVVGLGLGAAACALVAGLKFFARTGEGFERRRRETSERIAARGKQSMRNSKIVLSLALLASTFSLSLCTPAFAQDVRLSAFGAYAANDGAAKSSSASAGGELKFDTSRVGFVVRGQRDHELKAYFGSDLVGVAHRLNAQSRVQIAKGFFVIPAAVNLRRVDFRGAQGYTKYGLNYGLGGGVSVKQVADFTLVRFFKDRVKFDTDLSGKPIGNETEGYVFESNGYFPLAERSKWFAGHHVSLGYWTFIQPYDPHSPRYRMRSYAFGFRVGRRLS